MLKELESTFRDDFTIADRFGESWIKDTYRRCFKYWRDDLKYVTELVLVLNWKLWYWYEKWNMKYAQLYEDLWEELHDWCCSNLKGEELKYYLKTVD
jgi:hypothetical protein